MPPCPFEIAGRRARIDTGRLWATRRACSLALPQRLVGNGRTSGRGCIRLGTNDNNRSLSHSLDLLQTCCRLDANSARSPATGRTQCKDPADLLPGTRPIRTP